LKSVVIPANAGSAFQQREALVIQRLCIKVKMDPRVRGDDGQKEFRHPPRTIADRPIRG